jgi:hypothetical protein
MDKVNFNSLEELTYVDFGREKVSLYLNGEAVGSYEVFEHKLDEGREFILVNEKVIFLDQLNEK